MPTLERSREDYDEIYRSEGRCFYVEVTPKLWTKMQIYADDSADLRSQIEDKLIDALELVKEKLGLDLDLTGIDISVNDVKECA